MATKKYEYISMQQIRDNLNGFIEGLAEGKSYIILRRSRPVVKVSGAPVPGSGQTGK